MLRSLLRIFAIVLLASTLPKFALAQTFTENFDDMTQLEANGWVRQNNSSPLGPNGWYQGIPTSASPDPGPFNAYNGANNAYAAANFASTTGGTGTISNWLAMPNKTFRNGDVLTFYTRKPTISVGQTDFPDRLELRMSTNGASTNVGSTATGVGDFTTLLLSINPTLVANVYPQTWTMYTVTVSGLPAPTSGRMAFRYFVTNGGPSGSNSDYIGLDNVVYTPYTCPSLSLSPAGPALVGGRLGQAYSTSLSQTGALGAPSYAITSGALPAGLTLSPTGTISGTPTSVEVGNFTVTVNDASGCSGFRSYSISVLPDVPSAPQNVTATAGNAQAQVAWQAPASDGGAAISGYTVSAVQDPAKTCTPTSGLTCTVMGLTNGTTYTFAVVANNSQGPSAAGVSGSVTPTFASVTGTVPGMPGVATAAITGGGASCTFESGTAFVIPASTPVNRTLPYGGFEFVASGCAGSITVALTYPDPLPANIQFWKFGPATAGGTTSSWMVWSATLSPDRRTVTYSVNDNGVGDSNNTLGVIRDPFALALGGDATAVPVDNPWALAALAGVLGWLGVRRQRRLRRS